MKNKIGLKVFIILLIIVVVGGGFYYFIEINPDIFSSQYTVSLYDGDTLIEKIKIDKNTEIILEDKEDTEGFIFQGWYDQNGQKWNSGDIVNKTLRLNAAWIRKTFNITFVIGDINEIIPFPYGAMPNFPYSDKLVLEPTDDKEYIFDHFEPALEEVKGEATYTAIFNACTRKFSIDVVSNYKNAGTFNFESKIEYGQDAIISVVANEGYEFIGWFDNLGNPYVIDYTNTILTLQNVKEDKKIFAKFNITKVLYNTGFYDYISYFGDCVSSGKVDIPSEEVMLAWLEYITFYGIESSYTLNYTSTYVCGGNTESEMIQNLQTLLDKCRFPGVGQITYSYQNLPGLRNYAIVRIKNGDNQLAIDIKDSNPENYKLVSQYQNGLLTVSNSRDPYFDGFKYQDNTKTLSVKTSNQLVYAFLCGLKPEVEIGSNSERILNKAKDVLREICDDTMSDFEKVRAIYDWLILNVQYDHYATYDYDERNVHTNWGEYSAWYAEGVFDYHRAVCDGIAKAMVILCGIEGIPCVRVTGEYGGQGHAWNKVFIEGTWRGIDATHGDICVSNNFEMPTYTSFLFTDEYKLNTCTFVADEYTQTSETPYNVYATMIYGEDENQFDLYINNELELQKLLSYVKNNTIDNSTYYKGNTVSTYMTFEFAVASDANLTELKIKTKVSAIFGAIQYITNIADGNIKTYAFRVVK